MLNIKLRILLIFQQIGWKNFAIITNIPKIGNIYVLHCKQTSISICILCRTTHRTETAQLF